MKRFYQNTLGAISFLFLVSFVISIVSLWAIWNPFAPEIKEPSILNLKIDGVIVDQNDFVQKLRIYRENPQIKGVIIQINSPGGLVGSSQEIYTEIKRVRDEWHKPVVVSGGSILAGGAYLAAVAADRILAQPGTLMGSIHVTVGGVSVRGNTGEIVKEKNSQSYPMTEEPILSEMLAQFKLAIQKSRSLSTDLVGKYSEGQLMTGETAVRLGFADYLGTFEDAVRLVGDLAKLGTKPKIFNPFRDKEIDKTLISATELNLQLQGRPVYLLPGAI